MTCKINADTSDGLKIVSDTSGTVDIQNNGTTIAEVSSSSLAVTVAGSGVTDALKLTTTATNTVPGILFNSDISDSQHDIARIRGQQDSSSAGGIIMETETSGSLSTKLKIDSIGAITAPLQPAFSVVPASDQDDATGNGTLATVVFGTEIFDKNADFASNTFTAPVTGSYFLSASVTIHDVDANFTTGRLRITTSNRAYMYEFDPAENISGAGVGSYSATVLADMDAADTAHVTIILYDSTKTVDIQVNGTFFQGYLMG